MVCEVHTYMEVSMEKIILIGELGEIVRSLNECLTEEFQV